MRCSNVYMTASNCCGVLAGTVRKKSASLDALMRRSRVRSRTSIGSCHLVAGASYYWRANIRIACSYVHSLMQKLPEIVTIIHSAVLQSICMKYVNYVTLARVAHG